MWPFTSYKADQEFFECGYAEGDRRIDAWTRFLARGDTQSREKRALAYYYRGREFLAKGEADIAIADYDDAIRLNPNLVLAYYYRGLTYSYDKKDMDRAIADYSQAIRHNPQFGLAYKGRGGCYLSKGDHDRALADYNEAIRLDPKDVSGYQLRGSAYWAKRDFGRAIASLSEAIQHTTQEIDYKLGRLYLTRGVLYEQRGDNALARADFERVLALHPDHKHKHNDEEAAAGLARLGKAEG